MTMKEDQNAKTYDSKNLGRETDLLTFESKEIYESNDSKINTCPVAFEAKGKDECWSPKVVDEFSMENENENETKVSSRKEDQTGLSHHQTDWEKDLDSFSSDKNDKDEKQRSPEDENLMTVEKIHFNGNESRDSSNPFTSASDLSEKDTNLFSDKSVLKCDLELPEMEVCYKEINDHIVKDICVDEGRSENEKKLIENHKDDKFDNLTPQPSDDNHKSKAASEAEAELEVQASSSLLYNSNVESGSITFNFNSPLPDTTNQVTENVKEQSVDSRDGQDHRKADADDNFSNGGQAQCTSSSKVNLHDQSPEQKDGKSVDFSTDGENQQLPGNESLRTSTNSDVQAVDAKHELRSSGNVSQLQYDVGETSFSAASLITYSGPIVRSGSLSHRSDGSTASTRSFAFPVLQSEWNSSPVRMAKADRRQFRKNKCWRSGLLCCRF